MCGVIMVGHVVAALHCSYGCHVALLAMWPLYPGVRKDGGGKLVLTWTNMTVTTRRHRLDNVAHLPRHVRYSHAALVCHLDVVVHVCREGCARSIIHVVVVAVGGSGVAVGSVGVDDGGGGGNGTIVVCLLVVDDNKLSVGVCRRSLWV